MARGLPVPVGGMQEEVQAYTGAGSSFPHLIKELKGRTKHYRKFWGDLVEPPYDARKVWVPSWGS